MKGIKRLFIGAMCLSLLAGCSFFKDNTKTHVIKSIDTELVEADGSTKVTITYTDEDTDPVIFYIPKGDKGESGVGIKNITYTSDESTTYVSISYTDDTLDDTLVEIPNGVSVTGISKNVDEDGNTSLVFNYSNGTTSETIDIPKGEKGENGIGISDVTTSVGENNTTLITLVMTDGTSYYVTLPAPEKGKDGVGISSMVANETSTKYIIQITYTDGRIQNLEFSRPKDPNNWTTGSEAPSNTVGENGDFYFDIYHKNIYVKENGSWSLIVSLSSDDIKYTVRFDLNDEGDAVMPTGSLMEYRITRGMYFDAEGYSLPIPVRPGYDFMGWYRTKVVTPVNGAFTDITPVFNDLVLFANWKAK